MTADTPTTALVDILAVAREVLALADKTTRGPWEAGEIARISLTFDAEANVFPPLGESGPVCVVGADTCEGRCPDADFIAHARTAAPELAKFVELVDEVLREAQEDADRSADAASHMDITFMVDGIRRRLGLETP